METDDAVLLRFARQAMATTFEVVLPLGTPHDVATEALDAIDRLEQQMTVYRDDSEVSQLNREAASRPIVVEAELFDLFLRCEAWRRQSRGAFDIAAGALIKTWGFFRRQGQIPSIDARKDALARSGQSHLRLDPAARTLAFDRAGVEINLGSVGKGYAIDQAVRLLDRAGVRSSLVHGGHSSIFARGLEPGTSRGWHVGLTHPEHATRLGLFELRDRGLGISAATHQHFIEGGKKLGHILDPRTAWPADGVETSAVTAPTAAEADALATAFFILGPEPTREICQTRPEIGAVLLARGRLDVIGRARDEFALSPRVDAEPG